jgi:transposase-like protein
MSRVYRKYPKELKIQAVNMYTEEFCSCNEISKALDVSPKRIKQWLKVYEEHGIQGFEERRGKHNNHRGGAPKKKFNTTEEQLIAVKAELDCIKKLINMERM